MNHAPTILVNIDVEDLERAIRFYEEAIGLNLQRRLFNGIVAEMGGAASPLYLLQRTQGSSPCRGSDQVRDYRRHWTPVHLDFVVPELETAIDRAQRAGAGIDGGIQVFAWGRMALMNDPFGNGFCFVQWIAAGYDVAS